MRRREWLALAASTCSGGLVAGTLGCDRHGDRAREGRTPPEAVGASRTVAGPTASGGAAHLASQPEARPETRPVADTPRWQEVDLPPGGEVTDPGRVAVRSGRGAPLLVALHGAGENARGLVLGARGFRDDYALDRADARLHAPPLRREDFEDFVDDRRLEKLNASLAREAYQGLAVACPFTPNLRDRPAATRWATWLERVLLPEARGLAGTTSEARTGIDGVSMGGRLALLVGFERPELFDAVGASQPALTEEEAATSFADLALRAHRIRPRPIRLATSQGDYYRGAVLTLSRALHRRGVEHQLVVTPGPHDYAWNRGPGSLEMLLWHDRALRGGQPV